MRGAPASRSPTCAKALQSANLGLPVGELIDDNRAVDVESGPFLQRRARRSASWSWACATAGPCILQRRGRVERRPAAADALCLARDRRATDGGEYPAVTVAVTKKPGENAVEVADAVIERIDALRNTVIPAERQVAVTRNYGVTANDKAQKLIQKLLFATALGGRAGVPRARAARGRDRRRRRDSHADGDAIRVVGVGLHAEPRVAVRADLLDRHPGRRRDRRRGEHPPPPRARAR